MTPAKARRFYRLFFCGDSMAKDLIVVESPAKVKTIKKFLGNKYAVEASVGHVRDLPGRSLGVDEAHDFAPQYEIIPGKEKVVEILRAAAAKADTVYLAPDPDREGEAIAWHVAELLRPQNANLKRIQFNEITARAVQEAIAHPRELQKDLFDAQQTRRILDRLVGYKISPLLWAKVKRGISAGRVQSVALRLIVERERERLAFTPEEYWLFDAHLQGKTPPEFKAELYKVDGKKPVLDSAAATEALTARINGLPFAVSAVEEKNRSKEPPPPFITSTLQQNANQRLGYSAKRTMNIAQRLYEGVDLGTRGTTALITYMRTDSVRVAEEAQAAAKEYIIARYGEDHYPPKTRFFKSKGGAQDAHEAIRPVDVSISPEDVKDALPPDQHQLYKLIWTRFMASQMAAARYHDTTVDIENGPALWRCKGERILFPGFMALAPAKEETVRLPELKPGDPLKLIKLDKEQKFTQPPARYNEASLVRELEEKGIGRPSTYAAIISTLLDREYAVQQEKNFVPTDLGYVVCDQLLKHFPVLMSVDFTARMEARLDLIAEGKEAWLELMNAFHGPFEESLAAAAKNMESVKTGLKADLPCPTCGKELIIKFGKAGTFLACSGYPGCQFTSNFTRDENGKVTIAEREKPLFEKVGECPACGKDLLLKTSRAGGRFIACSGYPDCKYTQSMGTGVPCPEDGCPGEIVERTSQRGKIFYSCNRYPDCKYALWDYPVNTPCPKCNGKIMTVKKGRDGKKLLCPNKSCGFSQPYEE